MRLPAPVGENSNNLQFAFEALPSGEGLGGATIPVVGDRLISKR
jgi:hypothetical protein